MQKLQFIKENIDQWIRDGFISNHEFNRQYKAFCKKRGRKYKPADLTFNRMIQEYCFFNSIIFYPTHKWDNSVRFIGRQFSKKETTKPNVRNPIASSLF